MMIFFGVVASSICAPAAEPEFPVPKTPEWIWFSKTPKANEIIYLRREFTLGAKAKKAKLTVGCDDSVAVFVNGEHLVQHDHWQLPHTEEIASKLTAGDNVVALRCKNMAGTAALLARLLIETTEGEKLTFVSDAAWLAAAEPKGNWRLVKYDTQGWRKAVSLGKLGVEPWGDVPLHNDAVATDPGAITVPKGFRVERLYSVPKQGQGSWVSMTPDDSGRLIASDQYGGLYRITPGENASATKVEKLDVAIGDAQGLLYTQGSLYVVVNGDAAQGSGLYRLRDADGDDQFDEVKLLKRFEGAGEHGPHGIQLGAEGKLYVVAGNHTRLPAGCEPTSPHRNWAEDLLLPRNPDGRGHGTGVMAPGGWIARTDRDGSKWELFCAGFRNPYDLAFNQDGELFTYDADMEWDTGTPWYRPTRVNHAVSAAEFGWRYGTGKWPDYYADSVGAVVDIGKGSPTGIAFGTPARFPARYQRALFVGDWTYGKIYAVHLTPHGATYRATFETFVQGRPLPVTDLVIHPKDGAMYFTIGGRRTQSGLYRVRYVGDESTSAAGALKNVTAAKARALRRKLAALHGRNDKHAVELAWPHLGSRDRAIRYAARVAVEQADLALWKTRALAERRVTASIQALLALTRSGGKELQDDVLTRLDKLPLERMTGEQLLDALRVYQLAFIRLGGKSPTATDRAAVRLSPLFPHENDAVNRELCRLLIYLGAPGVVERAMAQLQAAQTQQDQLFYAFVLRNANAGWTPELRLAYFSWLNLAEEKYEGGASFRSFIQQTRRDAAAKLSDVQQAALADVIAGQRSIEAVKLETTRQFIHNWQMEDLVPALDKVAAGRSFERGKQAYYAAQCHKCHRFAGEGGATGPDITGVGNRFSPLYILESFLVPSKVVSDQYQNSVIATAGGEVMTGRVIDETPTHLRIRTSPFARELTEIAKDEIEERTKSKISEMPVGLINVLTQDEVLDLIAYLRSGGNQDDRAFKQ